MDLNVNLNLDDLREFLEEMSKIQRACPNTINTKRLVLLKKETPDCISTKYSILLKETEQEIGNVILINDGEIWYKVYKPFQRNGYATEAVARVIDEVKTDIEFYLSINSKNKVSRKVAKKLGFACKRRIWHEGEITMIFQKR